jgi:hypothetical protein
LNGRHLSSNYLNLFEIRTAKVVRRWKPAKDVLKIFSELLIKSGARLLKGPKNSVSLSTFKKITLIPMRWLNRQIQILALLFLFACSDDPSMIAITGSVKDDVTGLPIENVGIYFCPGSYFGNATVQVYAKDQVGTTDGCGEFYIKVPAEKAIYASHGENFKGVVLLFESCEYGHSIITTPEDPASIDQELKRPFIDSVRYYFNAEGSVITIETKTNSKSAYRYNVIEPGAVGQSLDIISTDGSVSVWKNDGQTSEVAFSVQEVAPGTWIKAEIPGIEANESYTFDVNAGSGISTIPGCNGFQVSIYVSANERPASPVLVFPVDRQPCN